MHRTDGDQHVANRFNDGDPLVPRLPTQITSAWLNDVQEEVVSVILDAGISLVKGTQDQLLTALRGLFVRVTGAVAQTITGTKTFVNGLVVDQSGAVGADAIAAAFTGKGTGHGVDAYGGSNGPGGRFTSSGDNAAVTAVAPAGYAVVALGDTTAPVRAALRLVPQNADPTSPQTGDVYATTAGVLKIYNGSAWVVVGTQT